ncbi:MAG: peptide-methionine (S)-S-oxide reductase MsrA [Flavobacteriaceae bacterium]
MEKATLAGGCFWCTETVFSSLEGVESVTSGYTGGVTENPTYKEVCTGTTGHAEAIEIVFNPNVISYNELLEIFFATHNPTTLNRQGGDIGTQYRSEIFYHNQEQKQQAEDFIALLVSEKIFDDPIVTQISEATAFYKAEDYHRDYFNQNPDQPYCQAVINPKVKKFKATFARKLKK